jgi:hypothetical protein
MAAAQQASIQAAGIISTAAIAQAAAVSAAEMARLKISTGPNAGTYTQNPNGTYYQISGPLAGRNVSAAQFNAAQSTPQPPAAVPPAAVTPAAVTPAAVTSNIVGGKNSLGPTKLDDGTLVFPDGTLLFPDGRTGKPKALVSESPANPKTTPPALNVYNAAQISNPAALPIVTGNTNAAKILPPPPTASTLGGIIEYVVELKWLQPAQKQGLNTTYGLPPGAMN